MALPVTISGTKFPLANYYLGPFKSSDGAIYAVLLDSSAADDPEVWKATDPTDSFTQQDAAGEPGSGADGGLWVDQEGDLLHMSSALDSGAEVQRHTFDMSSDTWTTVNESIEVIAGNASTTSCSIAHRSDGDLVVLYNGDTDKVHGTEYDRVDYAWHNGTSWNAGNDVTDAVADQGHWTGSVVVRGSDDRMHFCFKNDDLDDAYVRTLSGAATPALETMPSAIDVAVSSIAHVFIKGASYFDGTNHRVHCIYRDSDDSLSEVVFTSVDAPTYGSPTTAVTSEDTIASGSPIACCANDDDEVIVLFGGGGVAGVDDDMYSARSDDEAAWGTSVELKTNVSIFDISCNVYDRDGVGTVVALIYEEDSTVYYSETHDSTSFTAAQLDINKSYTTLADAALDMPDQNFRVGPFKIVRT